ncbi:uncharacterized protein NdufV3 [Euwallacea similis]|uniref:uncharacterized protein NdufV3 n=1 Tax=Euwallacea similis TaxID=1736056 RepID=UPI00344B4CC5
MPSLTKLITNVSKVRHLSSAKRHLTGSRVILNKSQTPNSSSSTVPNVKGLSESVVKVPSEPVGPGASKNSNYPNPEYFCYDKTSYYEAEVEMLKFRCPQPSVFKHYEHTNPK